MKLKKSTVGGIDTQGKVDYIEWDDELPGFGLRIREGGSRTYIIQYKMGAQHRRMTIGAAAKLDPDQARRQAKRDLGRVALGQDPQGDKAAARATGTFRAIAKDFIAHQETEKKRRASTIYSTTLYLMEYSKSLHALKPHAIGRAQVAAVLRSIANAHGAVSADRARAALSTMFAWAIGEGLCGDAYSNPVIGTNKHAPAPKEDDDKPGRALSKKEVAAVWNAAGDDDYGRIVKLLLLTGARRSEIAKLEWDEIQDDLISLPGKRTKNHLRYDIPLTGLAREIIGSRPETLNKFVFGKRGTGFSGFSKAKKLLDGRLHGVAPWRLHDLRHTVSTKLHEECGVQTHIVEACLNHVSGAKAGVAGRYNHAEYNPQKRDAYDKWANYILMILAQAAGNNVIGFPART